MYHSSAKTILKDNFLNYWSTYYVDIVFNTRSDIKPWPCRLENTAHYQKSVHPIKCRMVSSAVPVQHSSSTVRGEMRSGNVIHTLYLHQCLILRLWSVIVLVTLQQLAPWLLLHTGFQEFYLSCMQMVYFSRALRLLLSVGDTSVFLTQPINLDCVFSLISEHGFSFGYPPLAICVRPFLNLFTRFAMNTA